MMDKTRDRARGRWRSILPMLGVSEKLLNGAHHACPICGGTDRFRFDDREGDGDYFCNGCGPGSGLKLIMGVHRITFDKAARLVDGVIGKATVADKPKAADPEERRKAVRALLQSSSKLSPGSPAWDYLVHRCGITAPPLDLWQHAALRHADGCAYPGLVAVVRSQGGEGATVHRTYLSADGRKADTSPQRAMFGGLPYAGGSVRLFPTSERIGVAEGIETALCAAALFGVPTWATICAHGMETWEPPDGIRSVVVFGDNDHSCTGQAAAWSLGKRLTRAGIDVEIHIPAVVGTDWADEWAQQSRQEAA